MASPDLSASLLGRRKTRDFSSDSTEVEADDAIEIPKLDLAAIRTANQKSTCSTDTKTEYKCKLEDEESGCVTPKSEEHKISPVACCPPAPRKPKSIPTKINPANCRRAILFPSDSPELQLFFSSDLNADDHRHKKRQRMRESSPKKSVIAKTEEEEEGKM